MFLLLILLSFNASFMLEHKLLLSTLICSFLFYNGYGLSSYLINLGSDLFMLTCLLAVLAVLAALGLFALSQHLQLLQLLQLCVITYAAVDIPVRGSTPCLCN